MESSATATCQCRQNIDIMINGGIKNFKTARYFSCFYENCHTVVQADQKEKS
jgi:hypothetical protein